MLPIEMLGTETEMPGRVTETPGTETDGRSGTLGSVTGKPVGGVGSIGVFSTGGAVGVGVGVGAVVGGA